MNKKQTFELAVTLNEKMNKGEIVNFYQSRDQDKNKIVDIFVNGKKYISMINEKFKFLNKALEMKGLNVEFK